MVGKLNSAFRSACHHPSISKPAALCHTAHGAESTPMWGMRGGRIYHPDAHHHRSDPRKGRPPSHLHEQPTHRSLLTRWTRRHPRPYPPHYSTTTLPITRPHHITRPHYQTTHGDRQHQTPRHSSFPWFALRSGKARSLDIRAHMHQARCSTPLVTCEALASHSC